MTEERIYADYLEDILDSIDNHANIRRIFYGEIINGTIINSIFEIARYDSGLHGPHLDILHPDGHKDRVIDFSMLENAQAMNVAIEDFSNNWEFYLERWKRWLREKNNECRGNGTMAN